MTEYYEFYFFKSWQRLLGLGIILFVVQVIRISLLNANNFLIAKALIIFLIVIFLITFFFTKRKVIINRDGVTIENFNFGFKSTFLPWSKSSIINKEKYLVIDDGTARLIIVPFFWEAKGKKNILDVIYSFKA